MMRHTLTLALACLALTGCGSDRHLEDVRKFVADMDAEAKSRPGRIAPLPEVKPYEPFEYAAYDLIDPFVARKAPETQPARRDPNDPRLDPNRRKGPLEAFPLENLKMVGTLQQKKDFFALIKTPDNNLFRVKPGDFIGLNFGRISDIGESTLKLKELIQDSGNEWKEEERTLTLQDDAK